jgi:hypothetical protein
MIYAPPSHSRLALPHGGTSRKHSTQPQPHPLLSASTPGGPAQRWCLLIMRYASMRCALPGGCMAGSCNGGGANGAAENSEVGWPSGCSVHIYCPPQLPIPSPSFPWLASSHTRLALPPSVDPLASAPRHPSNPSPPLQTRDSYIATRRSHV